MPRLAVNSTHPRRNPARSSLLLSAGIAFLLLSLLVGCSGLPARQTPPVEPFIPPTRPAETPVPPTATPASFPGTDAPSLSMPTPTLECTNILAFASDLTIPDGTIVQPGEELEKRWQVRNSGTCNWDETYRIVLTGGPALGAPVEQALFPARSGTEAKVRMIFTAPEEPGTYRSAWQALDPSGQPFGDLIFIEIVVEG